MPELDEDAGVERKCRSWMKTLEVDEDAVAELGEDAVADAARLSWSWSAVVA